MSWLSGFWSLVQLVLKILGLIDRAQDAAAAAEKAEAEKRRQAREVAIGDQANAQTEEEFNAAQDRIVRNKP